MSLLYYMAYQTACILKNILDTILKKIEVKLCFLSNNAISKTKEYLV